MSSFRQTILSLFLVSVVSLPVTTQAADSDSNGKATAYTAVRGLQKQLGGDCLQRILEISGRNGTPQPTVWRITLQNKGQNTGSPLTEYNLQAGKIVARKSIPRTGRLVSDSAINFSQLNLDSSGAFKFANAHAKKAQVPFQSINYTLRADSTGRPVWSLQLINNQKAGIGTLAVSAHDASLVNATGLLATSRLEAATNVSSTPSASATSVAKQSQASARAKSQTKGAATKPKVATRRSTQGHSHANSSQGFFERSGRALDHTTEVVKGSVSKTGDYIQGFFSRSPRPASSSNRPASGGVGPID